MPTPQRCPRLFALVAGLTLAIVLAPGARVQAAPQGLHGGPAGDVPPVVPANLTIPLPASGSVPPIYRNAQDLAAPRAVDRDPRAEGADESAAEVPADFDDRAFRKKLAVLKRKHFGRQGKQEVRDAGIAQLSECTDWRGFQSMHEELAKEQDDVRLGMLRHFKSCGAPGQAALAWVAIHDRDNAIRFEATIRIERPACNEVLAVLDGALRCRNHRIVNHAGLLAGAISALPAIPLLMMAQVAQDPVEQTGDLAWIAIGTQQSYVANLIPVTGDGSGAFQPVIGTIMEGVVMRVTNAIAISYRTDVHNSLVSLTSLDWGQSTAHLGWDPHAWACWYNQTYVPFKQAQASSKPAHAVP